MANFIQGDLIYLKQTTKLPDGSQKEHPILIISSNTCNSHENYYTGVMVTHMKKTDAFTFLLEKDMFEATVDDVSQARLHITIGFPEAEVRKFLNRLKKKFVKQLLQDFNDIVTCVS